MISILIASLSGWAEEAEKVGTANQASESFNSDEPNMRKSSSEKTEGTTTANNFPDCTDCRQNIHPDDTLKRPGLSNSGQNFDSSKKGGSAGSENKTAPKRGDK
jgi:hypothetical protein